MGTVALVARCKVNLKMLLVGACLLLFQIVPIFTLETFEISDGVYSFGGNAYFSMFIVTGDGVMVIEPVRTDHSKEMLKSIREITNEPIKYLFYSHNHWDHTAGGQVFKDEGATIIAHQDAYDWLKEHPREDIVLPDKTWTGKKVITLGKVTLQLRYFGLNHGLGNTMFLLPAAKVAYIADNVTPNSIGFTVMPDFDIKEWERTLGEYLELDFEKAIYSHNNNPEPVKGGDKEDVMQVKEYLKDIRDGIHAELKKGTNPFKIPETLKLPKYKNWVHYDEWLEMNIWAVFLDEHMGPYLARAPRMIKAHPTKSWG